MPANDPAGTPPVSAPGDTPATAPAAPTAEAHAKLQADYNAALGRLKAKEEADQKAEEARLAEQGEHQKLAETRAAERDQARAELRQERVVNDVLEKLASAGANPDRLVYLRKLAVPEVTLGEDGRPANTADVVAQLVKDLPEMFGGKKGTGAPNDPPGTPQPDSLEALKKRAYGPEGTQADVTKYLAAKRAAQGAPK